MFIPPENFKGITFIQVSSLPEDQKDAIRKLLPRSKFIKILKDGTLLSDCVQFEDYKTWYAQFKSQLDLSSRAPIEKEQLRGSSFNLALD